jgi:hypothetical protein
MTTVTLSFSVNVSREKERQMVSPRLTVVPMKVGRVRQGSSQNPSSTSLYHLGPNSTIPKHTEIFSHLVTALSIHGRVIRLSTLAH